MKRNEAKQIVTAMLNLALIKGIKVEDVAKANGITIDSYMEEEIKRQAPIIEQEMFSSLDSFVSMFLARRTKESKNKVASRAADLYNAFLDYAKEEGKHQDTTATAFGRSLSKIGIKRTKRSDAFYYNVELKQRI